ncbi:hypothetical protein FQN49_003759 [Arthroderma sp. PD_2]|nr:hypothetical protein FQN49_003759 [Arthroderma sp. PD_2]
MSVPQLTRDLEAPLQDLVDDADRLAEWPELDGLEELLLDNGQLPSHRADRPCPQELHTFPDDISPELLQIINQPLEPDLPARPPAISDGDRDGNGNGQPQPQPRPSAHSHGTSSADERSSTQARTQAPVAKEHSGGILSERCISPESPSSKSGFSRINVNPLKETKNIKHRLMERNCFRECASCSAELLDKSLVPLGCMHKYCLGCFSDMIETAMKNENKFPPKCCLEDIPTKLILHNVDSTLREGYKIKLQEYALPRASRWYCPSPTCGKWIPPKKIKLGALTQKCPICKQAICTACQGQAHQAHEHCPQDPYPERIDSVASIGWRRCYKCQAMVDLTAHAGYVICHCGAEFCCFCGARGGTCGCVHETQSKTDSEVMHQERDQLAAMIAENERSERREVEERLRKEEIQRFQEEEAQRRQDDGRRRVQLDKEIKRLISISNQIQKLQKELAKINKLQQSMIITRHQDSAQRIQLASVSKQADFDQMRVRLEKAYESNFKLRKGALEATHSSKRLELLTRQEEDEDDNFVHMQQHLKGKPNREERQKVILDKLNATHQRQKDELDKAHKDQMSELDYHGSLESSALQSGIMKKLRDLQRETNSTVYELSSTVISDRRWFKIAIEKRNGLLEEHRMFLINGANALKGTVTSSNRYSSANNSSVSGTTQSVTSGRDTPQSPLSPPPIPVECAYSHRGSDSLKPSSGVAPRSRSRSMSKNGLRHVSSQSQFVYR